MVKAWEKPWFSHDDIKNGGKLEFIMGDKRNTEWGSDMNNVPPSALPLPEKLNYQNTKQIYL